MDSRTLHANPWLALVGLCLVGFLGCIDFTIVNTALPTIQADLHASVAQLQWIINLFMLALSTFMVVMGKLADIYGRRLVLYIGISLFGVASLGAGLAPTIQTLMFFRLLQGIGVAILYTVPVALVSDLFPQHQRGKATGILIGVNGFGLAAGPVIGGFILNMLNWRWIFFVNLPIIILGVLFCLKNLKIIQQQIQVQKIDWLGFLLLIIALPTAVLTTVEGNMWGWSSLLTLSLYGIVIVCAVLFYFAETTSATSIIDFKLFTNRLFISGIIANFSLAFFYTVDFFFLPLYLHNVQQKTGNAIGLILLSATAMVALLSPVVGYLVDKMGPKNMLVSGFLLFAVSALLQLQFSAQTPLWFILISLLIFGIGWAFILSPSVIATLASVPEKNSGIAMGTLGTLHNFGGAIGLALATLIYQIQGYSGAMGLLIGITILALATVLLGLKSRMLVTTESKL